MAITYPTVLAALLFAVGIYGVLARRNAVLILMSVELMLGAVTLNLLTFDALLGGADPVRSGQVMGLFVIVIAAAEVGLGLAIVLLLYRNRASISVDDLLGRGERVRQR